MALPSVLAYSRSELTSLFQSWDLSPIHVSRLWNYLYWECLGDFRAMVDLPVRVRDRLSSHFCLPVPVVKRVASSSDGFTRKWLLGLEDAREIEAVLMRFAGRATVCVSSQVGCAMGCTFCATGQMGFQRHLDAGEIIAQALHVQRILKGGAAFPSVAPSFGRLRNLVFMGMGEPLHNYEAVSKAVSILRDQNGFALGASRITLSTVGVVPGILRLAEEKAPVHLAVSLHSADQGERETLVPLARRWPLPALLEACRYYCLKTERRIFFEWTLIEGANDSVTHAQAVGRLLQGLPAQVNLIPLNPTSGYQGTPSSVFAARYFQSILRHEYKIPCTLRQRRGIDIAAGCGQLASG